MSNSQKNTSVSKKDQFGTFETIEFVHNEMNKRITKDSNGLYNLNEVWREGGFPQSKVPSKWAENKKTQKLIELVKAQNPNSGSAFIVQNGGENQGTWGNDIILQEYLTWLNLEYKLTVLSAINAIATGEVRKAVEEAIDSKPKKKLTNIQADRAFRGLLSTAKALFPGRGEKSHRQAVTHADSVFQSQHGFSWASQFPGFNTTSSKKLIERHETGLKTSQGLNKGVAPQGYKNKGELVKHMQDSFNCPKSLTEAILESYHIQSTQYQNEVEIGGSVEAVQVTAYRVIDVTQSFIKACANATQETECHAYFSDFGRKFKINVSLYKVGA